MTRPADRSLRRRVPGLTWLALVLGLVAAPTARAGSEAQVARAREHIARLDYDAARQELALADADAADVRVARALLALHEDRYDEALMELATLSGKGRGAEAPAPPRCAPGDANCTETAPPAGDKELSADMAMEALQVLDIARGSSRVTAATVLVRDEARGVEVRFQDEHDQALFPALVDTLERMRAVLATELGVQLPSPIRVLVVRDQLSLSLTTGLPYASATKTGTLGVAKWGRVTIVSPRATGRGYEWLDTIAHELTHLAISRGSSDRAPLWLQEGLAKRQEQRWRESTPRDGKISAESLALYGIDRKLDLPLDKLGPSLAMLPSAEQAMVVYAEVQSFVSYLVAEGGADILPKLLREIAADGDVDAALERASGRRLASWERDFRAHLGTLPRSPLPPLFDGGENPKKRRELSERVRLAELLIGREHPEQALLELARVEEAGAQDPRYRYVRGVALEALGRRDDALSALGRVDDFWVNHGPYWALRGRLETDPTAREAAKIEALRADPLGRESACGAPGSEALCEATKPSQLPALGQD